MSKEYNEILYDLVGDDQSNKITLFQHMAHIPN